MATAHPRLALRPLLPADVPLLREIFRDSIEALTGEDYSEAQQEAWAAAADDEVAFGKKLTAQLTLVATMEGSAVGFASLEGKDKIDMLYVHPAAAICTASGAPSHLKSTVAVYAPMAKKAPVPKFT